MQYSALQSVVRYSTVQCSAVQYSAVQCSAVQFKMQCDSNRSFGVNVMKGRNATWVVMKLSLKVSKLDISSIIKF